MYETPGENSRRRSGSTVSVAASVTIYLDDDNKLKNFVLHLLERIFAPFRSCFHILSLFSSESSLSYFVPPPLHAHKFSYVCSLSVSSHFGSP